MCGRGDARRMKHVTYAEKSLLMDDESAETLIEYAAALASSGGADRVRLRAVGSDGNDVEVEFLLNSATVLIVESASARLEPEPNPAAVRWMKSKMDRIKNPPSAQTEMPSSLDQFDFDLDEIR